MICNLCGMENEEGVVFCTNCGAQLAAQPVQGSAPVGGTQTQVPPQWAYNQAPAAQTIPEDYKPLSPWAYVGYQLLFAIPLVGFILLIVFSLSGSGNINRRNFARSYWCAALIGVILGVLMVFFAILLGGSVASIIQNSTYY